MSRDPVRERDHLAAALKPLMGSINYYMGPNARTAVGLDSVRAYRRLQLALARARGEHCPECHDTGRSRLFSHSDQEAYPCSLRHEAGHNVELSNDVLSFMVTRRDKDRAEDALPYEERQRKGHRVGEPIFEAELAELGIP